MLRSDRRRSRKAGPNVAVAPTNKSIQVEGSGTAAIPTSVLPAVVPNEKVAAVTVVLAVTPTTERLKVTPLSRKGL